MRHRKLSPNIRNAGINLKRHLEASSVVPLKNAFDNPWFNDLISQEYFVYLDEIPFYSVFTVDMYVNKDMQDAFFNKIDEKCSYLSMKTYLLATFYSEFSKHCNRNVFMKNSSLSQIDFNISNKIYLEAASKMLSVTLRSVVELQDTYANEAKTAGHVSKIFRYIFDTIIYMDSYEEKDKQLNYKIITESLIKDFCNNFENLFAVGNANFFFETCLQQYFSLYKKILGQDTVSEKRLQEIDNYVDRMVSKKKFGSGIYETLYKCPTREHFEMMWNAVSKDKPNQENMYKYILAKGLYPFMKKEDLDATIESERGMHIYALAGTLIRDMEKKENRNDKEIRRYFLRKFFKMFSGEKYVVDIKDDSGNRVKKDLREFAKGFYKKTLDGFTSGSFAQYWYDKSRSQRSPGFMRLNIADVFTSMLLKKADAIEQIRFVCDFMEQSSRYEEFFKPFLKECCQHVTKNIFVDSEDIISKMQKIYATSGDPEIKKIMIDMRLDSFESTEVRKSIYASLATEEALYRGASQCIAEDYSERKSKYQRLLECVLEKVAFTTCFNDDDYDFIAETLEKPDDVVDRYLPDLCRILAYGNPKMIRVFLCSSEKYNKNEIHYDYIRRRKNIFLQYVESEHLNIPYNVNNVNQNSFVNILFAQFKQSKDEFDILLEKSRGDAMSAVKEIVRTECIIKPIRFINICETLFKTRAITFTKSEIYILEPILNDCISNQPGSEKRILSFLRRSGKMLGQQCQELLNRATAVSLLSENSAINDEKTDKTIEISV